jgi:hypothetical protein
VQAISHPLFGDRCEPTAAFARGSLRRVEAKAFVVVEGEPPLPANCDIPSFGNEPLRRLSEWMALQIKAREGRQQSLA